MGYCSHNPAMQCSSIEDCNGCQAVETRLLLRSSNNNNNRTNNNNDLRWKNNNKEKQYNRNLAKPECNDGTCRKVCGDCAPTDPECDANHPQTCVVPPPTPPPSTANPTPFPTTASPTFQPTNAVCFILYMFFGEGWCLYVQLAIVFYLTSFIILTIMLYSKKANECTNECTNKCTDYISGELKVRHI